MNFVIRAVGYIRELLGRVRRKPKPTGRAGSFSASGTICKTGPTPASDGKQAPLIGTHFVEHLDPIASPVTYVDKSIVTNIHAMDDPEKRAADLRFSLGSCPLASPLSEVFSFAIKDHNPAIAVAVRDVHVVIGGINRDIRRIV